MAFREQTINAFLTELSSKAPVPGGGAALVELTDAREQAQRFEQDNRKRAARGLPQQPIDVNLLEALKAGLPDCSGVALGVDRLVMLALGAEQLGDVIAFTVDRA